MSQPFVAEIRAVAYNFPPRGWAYCDGQLLPISQNTALFSLLGTTYGGDGKSNFALPNLQGQAVVGPGEGPGLSQYVLGESAGEQFLTLQSTEMPLHSHGIEAVPDPADLTDPGADRSLARSKPANAYQTDASAANQVQTDVHALAPAGSGLPHNNMPPVLTLNFVIALQGVFPPRS
jgi:microcystin-dependent protein